MNHVASLVHLLPHLAGQPPGRYNARRVNGAKALYHRLIPERFRNRIGLLRREAIDSATRRLAGLPVPPRARLAKIQLTPWASEYLRMGKAAARSISSALETTGIVAAKPARILDFGCGSGRTLVHMRRAQWQLSGCDVDTEAIDWCGSAIPWASFEASGVKPPLPYSDASFDAVYAVSVFTHFSPDEQQSWAAELARIIHPGGILLVSSMGPGVIANFPAHATPENLERLAAAGSIFIPDSHSFNANAAFHSPAAIRRLFAPRFDLLLWSEQGLDGFQDLSVLRRR
jgi:SAM-dependent methyltransferase